MEGNSKVAEYKNQKQDQIINNDNDDYEHVCYSLNKLSPKQKKHLECNNSTIKNKFKKSVAAFKNKCFSKKKCCQDETNLQDTNHNLLMPNSVVYNDYNVKATRLLDESGYEVPICQHRNFLSRNNKQNINTINNTEAQTENSNKASTIKLQSTSLVKLRQAPQNLKVPSPIENKNDETLNNLQGIVHKRITMFEDFYNTNS